jgi:hypothetical protein
MTDQPGDFYVAECVAWIDSVEGLSDADRDEGRERFAVLLAHHDLFLHKGTASYEECLLRARAEFSKEFAP